MPKTDPTLWKLLARAIAGLDADLGACPGADIHQAALHHGIGPLLHQRATEGTVTGLGPDTLNQLKSLHRAEAARDLWQNEAARRVLGALAAAGIDALLLKGTALAHLHFPVSHLRPRCDVDLFISEAKVDAAAAALAALGCVLTGLGERKQSSRQFVAALPGGPQRHTHFDIHWKLSNRVLFRDSLVFAACLAEAQPVPALGAPARALSDTDLLLHACIHRIAHGRNTERDRLLWLYDIHLLIEAMAPAQQAAFSARAKARRIGVLCADALRVARSLFNGATPSDFLQDLEGNRSREPTAKLLHASKLRWAWGDMAALGSLREKAAFARELLLG